MASDLTTSRQDQIIDVAARLFANNGYHGVGVDEISAATGHTGPALYRHFSNKQAILDAVCIELGEQMLERTRQVIALGGSPEQVMDNLVEMRTDAAFRTEGLVYVIYHSEASNLSEPAQSRYAAIVDLYRAEWLRVLAQIRPNTSTSALHLAFHSAHNLIGYTAFHEHGIPEEELKPHLARMAKAVLLA